MFLLVLSLCGFASAISGRILDPIVTAIAADFGTTVPMVALLSTAYALPFAFCQPVLGPLGDLFSKAAIVKIAVTLLAVFAVASAMVPGLPSLFVLRVLSGAAGAGIVPIGFALIADRVVLEQRQLAISRFVAATLLGQLIGASLAGIVADALGWRAILWAVAVVTAIIAAATMVGLRRDETAGGKTLRIGAAWDNYRAVFRNPLSYVCFGVVLVEGTTIHGCMPFIGEYLSGLGKGGTREAGFVLSGLAIGGLVFASVVPVLLRLIQRRQMMALGGVLGGLGLAGIALGASWPVELALMALTGFGFFMLHNPVQTEVSELAPAARASAYSLHAFSFYLGQALGPVLYGLSLHHIGLAPGFLIAAVCFSVTGVTAYRLFSIRARAGSAA